MTATAPRSLTTLCFFWGALALICSHFAAAQTKPEPAGPQLILPGAVPDPAPEAGPAAPPAALPAAPPGIGATPAENEDVEVYTRGPLHEAFATPVTNDPVEGPLAAKAPPEAVDEVPPEDRPDGQNVIWVPGYWAWDAQLNDFLWISGVWRDVPPGRRWVPGYWIPAGENHRWVAGMWVAEEAESLNYLPQPPASLERGPSVEAPSENHFWVPGSWEYADVNYRWRPGYWVPQQESWIWVPSRYVMTPAGCVFVPGYWDYAVVERGVCFAPVRFHRPVVVTYTPVVVVNTWQNFWVHLWVQPRHCHYVFGDYYGPQYASAGFVPWCDYHGHRGCYDPIFVHDRWRYGPDFAVRLRGWNSYYAANVDYRPRVTLREQQHFHDRHRDDRRAAQPQIAITLNQVVVQKSSPMHFHRINNEQRVAVATQSRQSRDLIRDRSRLEGHERHGDNDRRGDNRPGNDNDRGNRGPDIGGRGPRDGNDRDRDNDRGPGRGSFQLPRDAQLQAHRSDSGKRDDNPSRKAPPSMRPGMPGSSGAGGRPDFSNGNGNGGRPGSSGRSGQNDQNTGIVGKPQSQQPNGPGNSRNDNDRKDGDRNGKRDRDNDRDGRRGNDGIGATRPGATLPGLNPGNAGNGASAGSGSSPSGPSGGSTLPGLPGRGNSGRDNDGRASDGRGNDGRSNSDRSSGGRSGDGRAPGVPSLGNPGMTPNPGSDGRRNNTPRTEARPDNPGFPGKSSGAGLSGNGGGNQPFRGQIPGNRSDGQPSPPQIKSPNGSDRGSSGRNNGVVPGNGGGRGSNPGQPGGSPSQKQPSSKQTKPKSEKDRGASAARPSGSDSGNRPKSVSPPSGNSGNSSGSRRDKDSGGNRSSKKKNSKD